jgi:hypothetical protein
VEYRNKRSLGSEEQRFLLEEDSLLVESGKGSIRIPFSGIREVRLRFQPNRYQNDVYECEIDAVQGPFRIFSRYVAGVLDFRDQGLPYRLFVCELCLRCARHGVSTRFSGGSPMTRYIGMGFLTLASMAFLYAALALLPYVGGFLVIVRLLVLAPMLIGTVLWFLKNRPVVFDPAAVPSSLLPSGTRESPAKPPRR